MISRGIVNAYGSFQTYYEENLLEDQSPDAISWIGSVQSFLLLLIGVVVGPLYDAGYFRLLIIVGITLTSLGFMMTSLCTEYWQILLAQAFCIGLGTGCLFIPSLALLPQYFVKRRAIATGIVTSGSSLGGTVYPLIFQSLLPKVGFPWATRVLGFICFVTCSFSLAVLRPRGKPNKRRSLVDLSAFQHRTYIFYLTAMFFSYVGFFGPLFYLQSYALTHGMAGENLAYYLVAIANAASVPGRIVPSLIAGRVGPTNMICVAAALVAAVTLAWTAVRDRAGDIAFAVAYGVTSGGIISLPAVVLASIIPDLGLLGTWMGMASVFNGFGSLIGPPVCGALLKATGEYLGVQLFSGFTLVLTAVFLVALRVSKAGFKIAKV